MSSLRLANTRILRCLAAWAALGFAGRTGIRAADPESAPAAGPGAVATPVDTAPEFDAETVRIGTPAAAVVAPDAGPVVREPSQGRPIFVRPGETFYFVMRLPAGISGETGFHLIHAMESNVEFPLAPKTPPAYVNDQWCTLVLQVTPGTMAGLYDLVVRGNGFEHRSRRCVRVTDVYKPRFRFIHLSDMNVGESTAPLFDDRLIEEINLLAPEFIVATGNYTHWARADDDSGSWKRVLDYFAQFDSPVFLLCGLHDHQASFTSQVASKPIGTIDYGEYRGLLMLDHAGHPADQDPGQLAWIRRELDSRDRRRWTFLVGGRDSLDALQALAGDEGLATWLASRRVRMLIVGGASDWDYQENADRLAGIDGFDFIRTHQSSTALRDRATGVSHYRVFEVNGNDVSFVYPEESPIEPLQHSTPSGRLRTFHEGANDGTADTVRVTIQNALNQGFHDARLWLRVRKNGNARPQIAGGRIVSALDGGGHWTIQAAVDLPDKGSVVVAAGAAPGGLPEPMPVRLALEGPRKLPFTARITDSGLRFYDCKEQTRLILENTAGRPQELRPIIRLNGQMIEPDRVALPRMPLVLAPEEKMRIPLVLQLRRLSPGPHALQVSFREDPLRRVTTFDVDLTEQSDTAVEQVVRQEAQEPRS